MVDEEAEQYIQYLERKYPNFFHAQLPEFHQKNVIEVKGDQKILFSGSFNVLSFSVSEYQKYVRREEMLLAHYANAATDIEYEFPFGLIAVVIVPSQSGFVNTDGAGCHSRRHASRNVVHIDVVNPVVPVGIGGVLTEGEESARTDCRDFVQINQLMENNIFSRIKMLNQFKTVRVGDVRHNTEVQSSGA